MLGGFQILENFRNDYYSINHTGDSHPVLYLSYETINISYQFANHMQVPVQPFGWYVDTRCKDTVLGNPIIWILKNKTKIQKQNKHIYIVYVYIDTLKGYISELKSVCLE